jgi:hypothetical protein
VLVDVTRAHRACHPAPLLGYDLAGTQQSALAATDDERMMWLAEAHAIIQNWDRLQRGEPMLSIRATALLADRIATALQGAYERGKAATAS